MGTNRLSDIWSLGCLFFELLTGEILFKSDELYKLCTDSDELVSKEKYKLLDNNVYLIDFLNFMLIKDPRLRPSISSVIKRFEHVHALLIVTGPTHYRYLSNKVYMTESALLDIVDKSVNLLKLDHEKRMAVRQADNSREDQILNSVNSIMTINKDISYCSKYYLTTERNICNLIKNEHITHIISMTSKDELLNMNQKFDVLYIDELEKADSDNLICSADIDYHFVVGSIVDFLRKAFIRKGKVLFIEDDDLLDTSCPKSLVGDYIILVLSRISNISAYEAYTKIRTINPVFDISHSNLRIISSWCQKQLQVQNYLKTFPTFECMCGACSIILKRQFCNLNNMYSTSCSCFGSRSFESVNCPSPGCYDFIVFMRKINNNIKYDKLKWGYLGREDFILGPMGSGIIESTPTIESQRQIVTASLTIDNNCEGLEVVNVKNSDRDINWVTYKCKYCYVWMYAYNAIFFFYSLIMNYFCTGFNKVLF